MQRLCGQSQGNVPGMETCLTNNRFLKAVLFLKLRWNLHVWSWSSLNLIEKDVWLMLFCEWSLWKLDECVYACWIRQTVVHRWSDARWWIEGCINCRVHYINNPVPCSKMGYYIIIILDSDSESHCVIDPKGKLIGRSPTSYTLLWTSWSGGFFVFCFPVLCFKTFKQVDPRGNIHESEGENNMVTIFR